MCGNSGAVEFLDLRAAAIHSAARFSHIGVIEGG
jgi:hypothetical protein